MDEENDLDFEDIKADRDARDFCISDDEVN